MKIIQSFAQFEEGSPYFQHTEHENYEYLLFYSFLLSYITLKKYYGHVTMFCNQFAYDTFIKYIPYDEVILKENKYDMKLWSVYKLDCIRAVGDDFIHVDPDVFIFDDLFRPFIDGDFDVIIQDILTADDNFKIVKRFANENLEFLADSKIFTKQYDGRCMSGGVLGLKKGIPQDYYFAGIDILYKGMLDVGIKHIDGAAMVIEELLLYLIATENDFKVYDVLPHDLILKHGVEEVGNMMNYVHAWKGSKYQKKTIDHIKRKILYEFPEYQDLVLKYESDKYCELKAIKYPKDPKDPFNFPILKFINYP